MQHNGTKYEQVRNMNITDIAKLVRKDLAEAFPTYKFSVVCQKYAGGCSLNIKVRETGVTDHWSNAGREITERISKVVDEYNYTDSDMMSDYHRTNFFKHVKVES